jgi:hypothetical protein
VPARLLTLDEVAVILRLSLRQVHLPARQGADPLPLAVAFLAQATLHTTDDDDVAATAGDGGSRARGVAAARAGGAR